MKIALGEEPTHVLASNSGEPVELAIKKTDLASFVKIQDMFMKHTGGYETDNNQKKPEVNVDVTGMSTEELIKRSQAISNIKDSE